MTHKVSGVENFLVSNSSAAAPGAWHGAEVRGVLGPTAAVMKAELVLAAWVLMPTLGRDRNSGNKVGSGGSSHHLGGHALMIDRAAEPRIGDNPGSALTL